MNVNNDFFMNGWQFPVEPDRAAGRINESFGEDNIEQSIKLILQTNKGERVMRPDFGCNLRSYIYSEINYTVMSEIETEVKQALLIWEPRITDIEVHCTKDGTKEGAILIDISYVERKTNNPYNMVYPVYLSE